ncbi:hypothetical protein [Salsipaludibacter albus]|uniref:hypothetical protein n=1 Tax=Salsipaludibacter albus TaxID=2849650 RepID=UPI001EE4BF59|nr:hypothetical protein [Salsipaludibacter albus]MBY5160999.1 hypothetical protein [Salsipaludibacter albus]
MNPNAGRDDRVLATTRWTAGVVALVLIAAGIILYLFPTDTGRLFAWRVNPPMTALAMGAGYLAGATFFVRVWTSSRWHEVALAFVAATVLTTLLLVATILHWENFSHGHVSLWTWTVVYLLAPVVLPVLWWRNRRHDPGAGVSTTRVPTNVRRLAGAVGVVQVGAALAFFVVPGLATGWWPWDLSPLTTRTVSAFMAFVGVVWLAFLFEPRWSALRLHVESATIGLVLVGVGLLRAPDDLTGSGLAVALVVGVLVAVVAAAVGLLVAMDRAPAGELTW